MTASKEAARAEPPPAFLADYKPFSTLWQGDAALYPSEQSARWAVRTLGAELAKAQAVAIHRRALLVHPERFAKVAGDVALARFQRRAGVAS